MKAHLPSRAARHLSGAAPEVTVLIYPDETFQEHDTLAAPSPSRFALVSTSARSRHSQKRQRHIRFVFRESVPRLFDRFALNPYFGESTLQGFKRRLDRRDTPLIG